MGGATRVPDILIIFQVFLISPPISRDFSLVFSSLSSQKNKSV